MAGFYIVGLWPFNFFPQNRVHRIGGKPGIHFQGRGIVHGDRPLSLHSGDNSPESTASFSIELWVQAAVEPSHDVPVLLSFYDGHLPENLLIGQWKSGILIRAPLAPSGAKRAYREVGVEGALVKGKSVLITITADTGGTVFYRNGVSVRRFPRYQFPWRMLQGRLVLGTAVTGGRGWRGDMYGLAIYRRSLNAAEAKSHYQEWIGNNAQSLAAQEGLAALYLFDQDSSAWVHDYAKTQLRLNIPERYRIIRKVILSLPWEDYRFSWSFFQDVTVNILGFIPFGFFFFLYRNQIQPFCRRLNVLVSLALGTSISLSIELIQGFLPSRSSQLVDLILNMAGTILGILAAFFVSRYLSRRCQIEPTLNE